MTKVSARVRALKEKLLSIRSGPGAAFLPKSVTKIHMIIPQNCVPASTYRGSREFWRNMLPRLKYHNPAVKIRVSRPMDKKGPAQMWIYSKKVKGPDDKDLPDRAEFKPLIRKDMKGIVANGEDAPPKPGFDEEVKGLDLIGLGQGEIWAKFAALTGAKEVKLTKAEEAAVEDLRRAKEGGGQESDVSKAFIDQLRSIKSEEAAMAS